MLIISHLTFKALKTSQFTCKATRLMLHFTKTQFMTISIKITFCCLFFFNFSFAQVSIQNQAVYGGADYDVFSKIVKTADGYYAAVASTSQSGTGNAFFANYDGYDYILIRYDNNFNIVWQKSFGGSGRDYVNDLILIDQALYLCGSSDSPVSGNKSAINYGDSDIWIVKTDLDGNKIWDRTYGGSDADYRGQFELLGSDLLVLATSNSSNDGNKITDNKGIGDYWLFSIDSEGDYLWQQGFGSDGADKTLGLKVNNSSIYIFGESNGGQNGDKSEPSFGLSDVWMIRTDLTGNIIWDKTIGGDSYDVGIVGFSILNNTLFLPMNSGSGVSGNRTLPRKGSSDIWVVKVNFDGQIIDQFNFGGDDFDGTSRICVLNNNIFIAGNSQSDASIDKTEDSKGFSDMWLLYFDYYGTLLWQKTIGGNFTDASGSVVVSNDTLVIAGSSASVISGDKTVPNFGDWDGWIIQLDIESLSVDSQNAIDLSGKLYPVPMEDNLTIEIENAEVSINEIKLYNSLGEIVLNKFYNIQNGTIEINTSELEKGSYIIEVVTGSGILRRAIVK